MGKFKIGSNYDEEWVEYQFRTLIVPFCESHGEAHASAAAQKAYEACLKEGLAPRATAKLFVEKCEGLLGNRRQANLTDVAVKSCIDYFKFEISKDDGNPSYASFKNSIFMTGEPADLDKIARTFAFRGLPCVKQKVLAPLPMIPAQIAGQEGGGGRPRQMTVALIIRFTADIEKVKAGILQKFPNIKFQDDNKNL